MGRESVWIPMSEVYGGHTGRFDDTSLAHLDETEQKQLLGEMIYPMIAAVQPDLAGKITGMLLEMQVAEVVAMLNSHEELLGRIAEALDVLEEEGLIQRDAESEEGGEAEADTDTTLAAAQARPIEVADGPPALCTRAAANVAAVETPRTRSPPPSVASTPAAVSPGGPPIDDDEDSELLRLAREQKQVLRKKLHRQVQHLAPERKALPVVGALLALENEILQALLRNRPSFTAAMESTQEHGSGDGVYEMLRAGLAMRRIHQV